MAVSEKILRNSKEEDFDRIIERLYSKKQARAVVMFVDEDNVRRLLRASIKAKRTGHFYWIASDSWGAKVYPVRDQEIAAVNSITILPHRVSLTDFDDYFLSLKPQLTADQCHVGQGKDKKPGNNVNCRNLWFNEFWSQRHKCTFDGTVDGIVAAYGIDKNLTRCTGLEDARADYEQEGLVPFVVDAVYAFAQALEDIITTDCGAESNDMKKHVECVTSLLPLSGQKMLKYIHNVSFKGPQGTDIHFNEDGDAPGYYNIYQYQQNDTKFDYVPIGTWKERYTTYKCMLKLNFLISLSPT